MLWCHMHVAPHAPHLSSFQRPVLQCCRRTSCPLARPSQRSAIAGQAVPVFSARLARTLQPLTDAIESMKRLTQPMPQRLWGIYKNASTPYFLSVWKLWGTWRPAAMGQGRLAAQGGGGWAPRACCGGKGLMLQKLGLQGLQAHPHVHAYLPFPLTQERLQRLLRGQRHHHQQDFQCRNRLHGCRRRPL